MTDLIERLRACADSDMVPMEKVMHLLTEAADALEELRVYAERWRQAFVDERASRYRADGMKIEQARIHAETDAVVAAIDAEREKENKDG